MLSTAERNHKTNTNYYLLLKVMLNVMSSADNSIQTAVAYNAKNQYYKPNKKFLMLIAMLE